MDRLGGNGLFLRASYASESRGRLAREVVAWESAAARAGSDASEEPDALRQRFVAAQRSAAEYVASEADGGASQPGGLLCLDPDFGAGCDVPTVLAAVLDATLRLTGADKGNIQLLDPVGGGLRIETQAGFEKPFLDFFAKVDDRSSACGLALAEAQRVLVEDVTRSPVFADGLAGEVILDAGIRAVQSIPLIGTAGATIGMLSVHYRNPHRPEPVEQRLLDLMAGTAAGRLAFG